MRGPDRRRTRFGFPAGIDYVSIYSELDAIIDWHTSLAPSAELIQVNSSHTGMGTDPYVHRLVAERLTKLARVQIDAMTESAVVVGESADIAS